MRIADLPTLRIDGVECPDLPVVRQDDPRHLAIAAALAQARLRALRGEGGAHDRDMEAAFAALDAMLAGVGDLDPERPDDPRVGDLAARLAAWHETVWYPKGEAIGEAWERANAGVRRRDRPRRARLEDRIIGFCEEIPDIVAPHGPTTRGLDDKMAVARLMVGRNLAEILNDADLGARIRSVCERRLAAAEAASGRSVADLVAAFEDAAAHDAGDDPWFEVVVEMSADGEAIAVETRRVRPRDEGAARARALVLARDGMFDHGRVPDRVGVLSVARADLPSGFAP